MKANVENIRESNAIRKNRKEDKFLRELAILDPSNGSAIVTVRIYGTNAKNYACIWVSYNKATRHIHGRGAGNAGGYGYHRESAALGEAIEDAGIKLSQSIDGYGDQAMEDACMAIGRAVSGKRKLFLHRAHG